LLLSVSNNRQSVRHRNSRMTIQGGSDGRGLIIVFNGDASASAFMLVDVWNAQAQVIDIGHYHRLKQVPEHCISQNGPASFHLKTATPQRMIRIDIVPQAR
jgi:hypothetical protein